MSPVQQVDSSGCPEVCVVGLGSSKGSAGNASNAADAAKCCQLLPNVANTANAHSPCLGH
jgi:hypothetical protein